MPLKYLLIGERGYTLSIGKLKNGHRVAFGYIGTFCFGELQKLLLIQPFLGCCI